MPTRFIASTSVLLLSVVLCEAQKSTTVFSRTEEFKSPDGMLVALVRYTKAPEATSESRIEVKTRTGRLLVKRNYSSEDGEHGYGVTKAEWTPDSQFFVYSLESSGGHSAWHSPMQFFSRNDRKITSLDDLLHDAYMGGTAQPIETESVGEKS